MRISDLKSKGKGEGGMPYMLMAGGLQLQAQ